jgi:hypothetical protein
MSVMMSYDLCLAWNWEYDADFVALLGAACQAHRLSLLQITPDNLADVWSALTNRYISFQAFLDRASDVDLRFMPLVHWARDHAVYRINPHEQACRICDKAAMHPILIDAGLHTPSTLILPPYEKQPLLPSTDLSWLGECFTIKPAQGGGGSGVVTQANSWTQVLDARREYASDRYLLQAQIDPTHLGSRPAWFRIIYCAGQVYPCWWDTSTHVYTPVTSDDETSFHLKPLRDITVSLAHLSELDLFSTEISLTTDGRFVIVDYVNDQIDLRLQSKAVDGVPDEIVKDVVERLAGLVDRHRSSG